MAQLTYDVELQSGERLELPASVVNQVGPGRWRVVIMPLKEEAPFAPVRGHTAFLSGYAPEDEGLYDDYPSR